MFNYAFDERIKKWVVLIDDIVFYVLDTEAEAVKKYEELEEKYGKS